MPQHVIASRVFDTGRRTRNPSSSLSLRSWSERERRSSMSLRKRMVSKTICPSRIRSVI